MIHIQTSYLLNPTPLRSLKIINNGFSCEAQNVSLIIKALKDYCFFINTGTIIDKPNKLNRFILYYLFSSYTRALNIFIRLKTQYRTQSISNIFSSAIWIERECFDLFGVFFENTTFPYGAYDLRRILTDYQFKGHPLRKDFTCVGYHSKCYQYSTKTIVSQSKLFL